MRQRITAGSYELHIEGAAIVAVKIDGVSHEYSTMEGVKEDVVQFIFEFKESSSSL